MSFNHSLLATYDQVLSPTLTHYIEMLFGEISCEHTPSDTA